MSYYIENFCPNPSFEVDLTGYFSVNNATLAQDSMNAMRGQYSLLVSTPGLELGEGVTGPQALFSSATTGSLSLDIQGETGTVVILALDNPGGNILGQAVVSLTTAWQRIAINGLNIAASTELYFAVLTTGEAQVISFRIDGVQYEGVSDANPYIDGDSPNCTWVGTAGLSASYQEYQNAIVTRGGITVSGSAEITEQGKIWELEASGDITVSGSVTIGAVIPAAAFDDFAICGLTDLDPAMTYVGWNNANLETGNTLYARNYSVFYPPLDYPVSDGSLLWSRAAFMAMGFEFASVGPDVAQNITMAQAEILPLTGNDGLDDLVATPAAYDVPRSLNLIVKPTRLNYCANPSFEVSTAGWNPIGTAVLSQDTATAYVEGGYWDGQLLSNNSKSMKVSVEASGDGTSISLTNLIAGNTYIASAYVLAGNRMTDITLSCGSATSATLSTSQGALQTANWMRPYVIFTATGSTMILTVIPTMESETSYPVKFWVDAVLVEQGEVLQSYFDGGFSNPDYIWELNSTPGLGRSYYYEELSITQKTVLDILDKHIPMGLSYNPPQYGVPPTQ